MLIRTIFHLLIALAVCPQAIVYGGLVKELRRKLWLIWHGKPSVKEGPFYGSCNLCMFSPCTPIIHPSNDDKNFDGTTDATQLNWLFTIIGNGELNPRPDAGWKAVIDILVNRSAEKRTIIANSFKQKYGNSIKDAVNTKISKRWKDFGDTSTYFFLETSFLPMPVLFAQQFQYEMGLQRKENVDKDIKDQSRIAIVEMLMTLPKCLIDEIEKNYNSVGGKNFFKDLNSALEIGGILPENRDFVMKQPDQKTETSSWFKALLSAYKLKSAIESHGKSTFKKRVSELITKETDAQLTETLTVYGNIKDGGQESQSLFDNVDSMESLNELYRIRLQLLLNKSLYFAKTLERIFKSGANAYKYEDRFLYLIRGRYDIDLKDIIKTYNNEARNRFMVDFTAWAATNKNFSLFREVLQEILRNTEDR